MKHLTPLIAGLALLLPLAANATMNSDKIASSCAAKDNPGCMAYTLGGADRFWLVSGSHTGCNAAADKKALDALSKGVKGEAGLYKTDKPQPAALPLIKYLNANKLQSCSINTRLSDIAKRCASQTVGDQVSCHAYIAGAIDMAIAMDEIHQATAAKDPKATYQSPFCENGQPKKAMTNDEVMKTIGDYSAAHATEAKKMPAAAGIVDALLEKYPCGTKATAVSPAAAPTTNTTITNTTATPVVVSKH